jgi:hypothetical protein
MNFLTREAVLEANDLKSEAVPVPEWGGAVSVRMLSAKDRDAFDQSLTKGEQANMDNVRARFCVRCIVDEGGNRIFTDDDADVLGAKSAQAMNRVFAVAQRLNGMSKDAGEEIEKNSGAGQTGASTSA